MPTSCLLCGEGAGSAVLTVREMMLGLRERFDYRECGACGSFQIMRAPADMGRYYPSHYYSFAPRPKGGVKAKLRSLRDASYFGGGGVLGRALARASPQRAFSVLAKAGLRPEHRVLDVGCGSGALLDSLARMGFRRLLGADPFIAATTRTPEGVEIRRVELSGVEAPQDVIMFNHSLEHVPDPAADLRRAARLLPEGGLCVVRAPTPSSRAHEIYGADWVQFDAPRHIFLPSRDGMARLADRAGFQLEQTIDDSWSFQFWGSELYRRNRPLNAEDAEPPDPEAVFGAERMTEWSAEAERLNREGRGDQAAFVLRRL